MNVKFSSDSVKFSSDLLSRPGLTRAGVVLVTMSRGLNYLLTSDLLASLPFKDKSFSFCLSFKSVNDTDVVSEA